MTVTSQKTITSTLKNRFDQDGYVIVEQAMGKEDLAKIESEIAELQKRSERSYVYETDGRTLRSINGPHLLRPYFNELTELPILQNAAEKLIGAPCYIHQYKINFKNAFGGDVWEWHSDFCFWNREDGMRHDTALSAAIYLDEVDEFNGPMFVVPGSHKVKIPDEAIEVRSANERKKGDEWLETVSSRLKYGLKPKWIDTIMMEHGLASAKAPRGSILFFHSSLLHASGLNLSSRNRRIVFLSFNALTNRLETVSHARPEFMATRM